MGKRRGALEIPPRFGYLRQESIDAALEDVRVVDTLIEQLLVPGKLPQLKRKPKDEKLQIIWDTVDHHVRAPASGYYGLEPYEVISSHIWRGNAPGRNKIFSHVAQEKVLEERVFWWFFAADFLPFSEVPLGHRRADVVAWMPGKRLLAVELKNSLSEFDRATEQMMTYRDYAHAVYLACSPAFAVQYVDRHFSGHTVETWDPHILDRRLKELKLGLILVEREEVFIHIEAPLRTPSAQKILETENYLQGVVERQVAPSEPKNRAPRKGR